MICLELGDGSGTTVSGGFSIEEIDYYNNVYYELKSMVDSKKHYIVSIYDKVSNVFMGDAEVIGGDTGGNVYVTSLRKLDPANRIIGRVVYSFNLNYYTREYAELVTLNADDYNQIKDRLSALEQKLNEITQIE